MEINIWSPPPPSCALNKLEVQNAECFVVRFVNCMAVCSLKTYQYMRQRNDILHRQFRYFV